MKFRLWEKSFLLTFAVFFVLLNASLGIWSVMNFKSEYSQYKLECENEAENIYINARNVSDGKLQRVEFQRLCSMYDRNNTYIKAEDSSGEIYNTLSGKLPEIHLIGMTEITEDIYSYGTYYYCNFDVKYMEPEIGLRVIYAKDMSAFFTQQKKSLLWLGAVDLLLGIAVGILLYIAMKKIYRPVNNISHELRTPLTSIQGYAQYLEGFDLREEDRRFALQQIIGEARYMDDIIDKLLAIESLKNVKVRKQKVDFNELLEELKLMYPELAADNNIDFIYCDRDLFKSMLMNLIGNAAREGGRVQVTGIYSMIRVSNEAGDITEDDIKMLNKGGKLSASRIKGHGYGIELCREIAKVHRWHLKYELDDGVITVKIIM